MVSYMFTFLDDSVFNPTPEVENIFGIFMLFYYGNGILVHLINYICKKISYFTTLEH